MLSGSALVSILTATLYSHINSWWGPRSAIGRAPDSFQGSWVRYPVWQHTFVSPSAFSRRAVVSYWRKYVHEVLVNRLGGLSLPRKSVVRLTDRPDMTLDVYRGRKTTNQQQQLVDYRPLKRFLLLLLCFCFTGQHLRSCRDCQLT